MSKLHSFKFLWDIRRLALVGLAVLGLLLVGCDQATEVTSVPQEEALLELATTSQIQAVMAIQDRHTDRLLAISGAVGTATGLTEDGRPAIVVFITTGALAKSARIPASIEEVPVIVEVTGMFVALTDPKARQPRPVPIGVSTGHPDITAGTIGARVTNTNPDGSTNVFALSNNHVYANINKAKLDDSALQPGPFDGGEDPADKIGKLFDFEVIKFSNTETCPGDLSTCNEIDAAIAISSTDLLGNSTPTDDGYGTPNSTIVSAALKQVVQKYGRTTGLTTGEVSGVNAIVDVCYKSRGPFMCNPDFIARFVNQIVIKEGDFSSGGDSGSLIVTKTNDASNNPVGLLFAGSSTRTIANPIGPVLNRFGVTIDGETAAPNVPPSADADGPYSGTEDAAIVFDGSGSSDPDGDPLTYTWDFGDGNTATSTSATISHTYLWGGTFTVTLTVSDGRSGTDTASSSANLTEANDTPVADPNGPYGGTEGEAITFDGSGSSDFDNEDGTTANDQTLTYTWDFGDGNTETTTGVTISHTYAVAGTYTVTLVVNDGTVDSDPASTTATVSEPAAGVGVTFHDPPSTQSGDKMIPVTVDGSGFAIGAKVTYENGSGPAPKATVISVTSTQITAETTLKAGGPPRDRFWDVRVTNPDGSIGVLVDGFKVTP